MPVRCKHDRRPLQMVSSPPARLGEVYRWWGLRFGAVRQQVTFEGSVHAL